MDAQESIAKGRAARSKAPSLQPRGLAPRTGPAKSHRDPRRAGQGTPTRPRATAPHTDARVTVHVLPRWRRRSWPPTWREHRRRESKCSAAATRTWPNFGGFESPERSMVFSINDFDETLPGPWEWDLKRLAASLVVGGARPRFRRRDRAPISRQRRPVVIAPRCVTSPRNEISRCGTRVLDLEGIIGRWGADVSKTDTVRLENLARKGKSKTSLKAFAKLTETVDGTVRIRMIRRWWNGSTHSCLPWKPQLWKPGRASGSRRTPGACRPTAAAFLTDFTWSTSPARSSASAASVHAAGSRCFSGAIRRPALPANQGSAELRALDYLGKSKYANQGQHVVMGQHLMQAASDILLGWAAWRGNRRRASGLLRSAALGREDLGRSPTIDVAMLPDLRTDVQLDARACSCPFGRSARDRRVSRLRRCLRPRHRRVRARVCRPEPRGLRCRDGRSARRPVRDRTVIEVSACRRSAGRRRALEDQDEREDE